MKLSIALAALFLVVPAAAHAQESAEPATRDIEAEVRAVVEESGIVPALEAIATETAPELEAALGRLATTLGEVGMRLARDPEVRESTRRGAQGMVRIAEVVVTEQSDLLIDILRRASEQLEAIGQVDQPRESTP
jgi:hypothetical protein